MLLSGEYFVLDGALAIALPTKQGQSLVVETGYGIGTNLYWKSYNSEEEVWFEGEFEIPSGELVKSNNEKIGKRLATILTSAKLLNPNFLEQEDEGLIASTYLGFPNEWGLGTSSTLLHNIASWAKVDPFELSDGTFGGSGYDIACAGAKTPIAYNRLPQPYSEPVFFDPIFKTQLYFVYLGQKQNSREGIARYRQKVANAQNTITDISVLSHLLLKTVQLKDFEEIIREHEAIVSTFLDLPRAKKLYFEDFWGEVKSLGAWGGDFVLVTSNRTEIETRTYFMEKGFEVFLSYETLIR